MKRATIGLLLAATLPLCCSKPATPPPGTGGLPTISIRVFVLRDLNDDGQPPQDRLGYIYSDNHIRELVLDMIDRSYILAGTDVNYSWPGQQVYPISRDLTFGGQNDQHLWWYYTQWVPYLMGTPGYDPNAINIFFVPGIVDASAPTNFMDTFTIDPAGNNDPYWSSNPWDPMMIVSDCWVWSGVNEQVDDMPGNRRIPTTEHFNHLIMHHALGRYLFRHTDVAHTDPLWDDQENWVAGNPGQLPNYMRRWNWRAPKSVWQGEIFERINSGNWNNP